MARLIDFRNPSLKNDEACEPEFYQDPDGNVIMRINPYDDQNEAEHSPSIFITMSLAEVKNLLVNLQECFDGAVKQLMGK